VKTAEKPSAICKNGKFNVWIVCGVAFFSSWPYRSLLLDWAMCSKGEPASSIWLK